MGCCPVVFMFGFGVLYPTFAVRINEEGPLRQIGNVVRQTQNVLWQIELVGTPIQPVRAPTLIQQGSTPTIQRSCRSGLTLSP